MSSEDWAQGALPLLEVAALVQQPAGIQFVYRCHLGGILEVNVGWFVFGMVEILKDRCVSGQCV